ncbi:ABC transporter substrate-binding protein [Nocardia sp. NPDC052278]|uniref:ABC transporter substrate-binding protein n=1 Tax=unclassified Nocardia TaxID=2637762 RepID=UPI0036C9022F
MKLRNGGVAAAIGLCLVVALTACGKSTESGGASDNSGNTSQATANVQPPVKLFFINAQGATTGASYPQETVGAKAATAYINEHGGIDGHPLELDTCFTDETPASTTNCANQAAAANPIAVATGTLADDNNVIAVTAKAGVPIVSNFGATADVLKAEGKAYIFNANGQTAVAANGAKMKERGVKKVAVIYVNVPAVVNGIYNLAQDLYTKNGIGYTGYPVPYPSPDLTPTLTAVQQQHPDAVVLISDAITCGAAFKAALATGFDKPFYVPGQCKSNANSALVGSMKQNVYINQFSDVPNPGDPDVKTFTDAMKAHGGGQFLTDSFAIDGFQGIMNIAEAMRKAPKSPTGPTREGLISALQAGGIHQFLMGPSTTFTCDGKALPSMPAICAINGYTGTWKPNGVENLELGAGSRFVNGN